MNKELIEYYFSINEKYHDEVYDLINILEISIVDEATAKMQEKTLARLEELKKLSK